ncbi:MobF family relaxase [Kribbella sp. NPDC056951]|uniref:MobF family relaxase n=1 Tax=Kribbella sp. NPDC056951 TaxID=3345978 RepID=UPI003633A41A
MMSMSAGHDPDYLLGAVATGRENYYTGAVAAGEPPGRWYGRGAEALGLRGEVDHQDMAALYERFIDPHDPNFRDPLKWDEAGTLGHTGRAYKTQNEKYKAALAAEPYADAARQRELYRLAGKGTQQNTTFLDATFSVQKSVTVLHTAVDAQAVQSGARMRTERTAWRTALRNRDARGAVRHFLAYRTERKAVQAWSQYRDAIEEAIWAGNRAGLDYLADKAGYVRIGHHGGVSGRWADAHDLTVASFFQHDGRDHDPQLHIHNAILNRVQGPDGKWRTLDSKAFYKFQSAAGSVAERVMEQHLSRVLGVQFKLRPDGEAREIVGVDQNVMDLFSKRRLAITKKTSELVKQREAQLGRKLTNLELDDVQNRATDITRQAKSHGETATARLERWDRELRAQVSGGLRSVAEQVLDKRLGARSRAKADTWTVDDVLAQALARVQETQAEWRAGDLTRAISMCLPDELGQMEPDELVGLLDELTREGLNRAVALDAERPGTSSLPEELRLANGDSSYRAPGRATFATPGHLNAEDQLARAAYARGGPVMTDQHAKHFVALLAKQGLTIGADQESALKGILTSGARVEALIGPAGTGKSRVVGSLAKAWTDPELWHGQRRRVVGLAVSQVATDVLKADGVPAMNIAQWLQTQARLTAATTDLESPHRLRSGDLVIVDEAAMASTDDLTAIAGHCEQLGAKLLVVGDHRQLGAVGAGGGMELVTAASLTHELSETHRFAEDWEGPASLRLRTGDASVLDEYHRHGRIVDGGQTETASTLAQDAWLADHLRGLHALLIVDTNEQAAQASAQIRARLVNHGLVDDEHTVVLGLQGTHAGRGDLIQARRNDWALARYGANNRAAINRAEYEVLHVSDDGSLLVAPLVQGTRTRDGDETMILPASYVASHVALAYASTVHSAQGLTVDTAHGVVSPSTSLNAVYVAASRGRGGNHLYVVTKTAAKDAETGDAAQAVHRSASAVLTDVFDADEERRQRSATEAREESAAEAARHRTPAELLADGIAMVTTGRTDLWLDGAVAQNLLTADERTQLAAEAGASTLNLLLRRVELAGHDARAVLYKAITSRSFEGAAQLTSVIQDRITKTTRLDPAGGTYSDRLPRGLSPEWARYLEDLAAQADLSARELAFGYAADTPAWLADAIGPCPVPPNDSGDPAAAPSDQEQQAVEEWLQKAAKVAGYRDLSGYNGPRQAIGPAPAAGQTEDYASWRAAWTALGQPEDSRPEAEMTEGQLRVRVAAYQREQNWAPPSVVEELAGTVQAADRARQRATLLRSEATAQAGAQDGDDAKRAGLLAEADQAEALAQTHDEAARELREVDNAYNEWLAHTAATKQAHLRAVAELKLRDLAVEPDPGKAAETEDWWAQQRAAQAAEDDHLHPVDEHDLAEVEEQRRLDLAEAVRGDEYVEAELVDDQLPSPGEVAAGWSVDEIDSIPDAIVVDHTGADHEPITAAPTRQTPAGQDETSSARWVPQADAAVPVDVRQATADEPRVLESSTVAVPSIDDTAEAVRRAQRALIEIRQRSEADQAREAAEHDRDDLIADWHADDTHHRDTTAPGTAEASNNNDAAEHAPRRGMSLADD